MQKTLLLASVVTLVSLPAYAQLGGSTTENGGRAIMDERVAPNSLSEADTYPVEDGVLRTKKRSSKMEAQAHEGIESTTSTAPNASMASDVQPSTDVKGALGKDIEANINTDLKSTGFEADMKGAAGSTLGAESSGGLRGGASLTTER